MLMHIALCVIIRLEPARQIFKRQSEASLDSLSILQKAARYIPNRSI